MLVDDEEIEDMFLQEEKISDECRLVFNPGFRPRYTKQELKRITEAASPAFCHNMVSAGGTSIESPVNEMAWATHSTNDTFRFAAACSPRVVDNGTMLVFSGDRKVVNGVKSEDEVYRALYNHLMTLSRLTGLPMNSRDPSVTNTQCVIHLNYRVNLPEMAAAIKSSVYHPSDIKQLRCQIVLPPERRITYLVRVSGCVVMTGAATTEEIITARNEIVQVVANFVTVPCPTVVDRLKPQRTKLTKSSDRDDDGKSYKRRRTPPLGLVGPKDWFRRPGEEMAAKKALVKSSKKKHLVNYC